MVRTLRESVQSAGISVPLDTSPDVENMQIELLRQMPPWRKMALMAAMSQTVRTLAMAGLRQRDPDDTPALRQRRMADLLLGPELAARVYGPWPEKDEC